MTRKNLGTLVGMMLAAFFAVSQIGCGGSSPPPPISVSLSPSVQTISEGESVTFTATVLNDSTNAGVTWNISVITWAVNGEPCAIGNPSCGTVSNQTATSFTYTAPTAPRFGRYSISISATSAADVTKTATESLQLVRPSVSVLPASTNIALNGTEQLTATVTNDATNSGVTWSLSQNGVDCAPGCGTISPSNTVSSAPATYTAPATAPAVALVTVTATSVESPTSSGSAQLTLTWPGQIVFSFGAEETVFTHNTDSCESLDVPDTPAHAVRLPDGSLMLKDGDAPRNYAMFGTDFNSLHKRCTSPILVSDDLNTASSFDNLEWVFSVYSDGKVIHGLIHNEFHDSLAPDCKLGDSSPGNPCWYNSITYAVSTDGGQTFTHTAPPEDLIAPAPQQWDPTGQPTPYGYFSPSNLVHAQDGFYYSLFMAGAKNTTLQTCIMRTQTLGDPTSWRAWDGTGFNLQMTDPYTGPAPALCTSVAPSLDEPTLTYNTYLGKYMMVGSAVVGNTCGAAYALSSDLIHWTAFHIMRPGYLTYAPCQPPTGGNATTYFSIIDQSETSANFEKAGQTPYLYYTRFNDTNLNRDLVRVPVTITIH